MIAWKWCVYLCFENVFEIDAFVSATVVMTRVWVYTKVCIFSKRCFKCFFESLFWKCLWSGLKSRQVFLQVDQVTKSLSIPIVLKGFSHVLTLFNNFVPPLYLVDNLAFRMFNGTGAGHRVDHECNGAKCLWQFAWRDLIILIGDFRKRHRGTYDHLNLFCQRNSTCKHGPFWKATCGITLGGASVIVYWLHVFVLY